MSFTDAFLLEPYPFEIWLAIRTDGQIGSGTLTDPYDGSSASRFDKVMSELMAPGVVHLGPGTFLTVGYSDGPQGEQSPVYGWQMKPGVKITGAGVGATVLKLVNANVSDASYFAIGHALTNGSPRPQT